MKVPATNAANPTPEDANAVGTREIVKRHMEDPNHHISDEEISKVVISTDHINLEEHPLVKALDGKTP
ncbi:MULTISPECIES: hypothetical protein [Chitinophagaceae]|uniref:hypothetical protein n=1 Tax=Chitinophagaceae TaxID=563835 RepID=UPI000F4DE9A5|nr:MULTISPECIES: hypothetical protein [Chitinophagaceae]RPD51872.1 hypothetical protein DRJ53_04130 [Paracnuella aquatica]